MPKSKNPAGKPSVSVSDLPAKNDPKGGGKNQPYIEIKLQDVLISSVEADPGPVKK